MKSNLFCEIMGCDSVIGNVVTVKGKDPTVEYTEDYRVCEHCGAEFCKSHYDTMHKCYCCGRMIDHNKDN